MAKFKEGDRVQVKARQATEREALEGHYAPFLAGATGTILKIYDAKQIAVNLDIDSLPEEVRQRHAEQQEAMYRRWFDSLSEEARNRLTDEEKAFRLNYVALLTESDLESPPPAGSPRKRGEASGEETTSSRKRGKPSGKETASSRKRGKPSAREDTSPRKRREPTASKMVSPAPGGTSRRVATQPTVPSGGRASQQAQKAAGGGTDAPSRKPRKQAETAKKSPAPAEIFSPGYPGRVGEKISPRPTPEQLDLMEEAYLKARQRKAH